MSSKLQGATWVAVGCNSTNKTGSPMYQLTRKKLQPRTQSKKKQRCLWPKVQFSRNNKLLASGTLLLRMLQPPSPQVILALALAKRRLLSPSTNKRDSEPMLRHSRASDKLKLRRLPRHPLLVVWLIRTVSKWIRSSTQPNQLLLLIQ